MPLASDVNVRNLQNSDHKAQSAHPGNPGSFTKEKNYSIRRTKQHERMTSIDSSADISDQEKSSLHPEALIKQEVHVKSEPGETDANDLNNTTLRKRFFCRTCNQGFTRKHNMVSHELIHLSTKPHTCSVCETSFRRIHDLKRHEKLHTGEKPFVCNKCYRRFARIDALTRHFNLPNACSTRSVEDESVASEAASSPVLPEISILSKLSHNQPPTHESDNRTSGNSSASEPKPSLSNVTTSPSINLKRAFSDMGSEYAVGPTDSRKANHDINRWREQQSRNADFNFPSNSVRTPLTIFEAERSLRQTTSDVERPAESGYLDSKHFNTSSLHLPHHEHSRHQQRHDEEQHKVPWSLSSESGLNRFRKHEEYYPIDIRSTRDGRGFQQFSINGQDPVPLSVNQGPLPYAPPHYIGHHRPFEYSAYPTGSFPVARPQPVPIQMPHFIPWSQSELKPYRARSAGLEDTPLRHGPSDHRPLMSPSFISMSKYQDLMIYATTLQNSLANMDNRLRILEKETKKDDKESSPQFQQSHGT